MTDTALREVALEGLMWKLAHENIGIYCKSVSGPNGYEKRTERMEGWNECAMEHTKHYAQVSDFLEALPPDNRALVEDLLLQERLTLSIRDEGATGVELMVLCNDLFFWACADAEGITLDELPALIQAYKDCPRHGDLLWVCRKRQMRPQGAYYQSFSAEEWPLFDAAGPEREDSDGKARPKQPHPKEC